jgi:uncharacterized protein YjdB
MRRHFWSGAVLSAALSLVIVGCSSDSSAPTESVHGTDVTGSTQIALTRKADTLTVDQALQLKAIVPPAPGTIAPAITWTSSDTSVAIVTQHGALFGLKSGKVTVTVSSRGYSAATAVTVRPGIRDVVFEADSIAISLAQSVKIPFRVRDTDGNLVDLNKHRVEWVSTAPDIAPLTGDATVTGRSIGRADLLLRVDNKVGSTRVKVMSKPVASVFVTPSSLALDAGQSTQLIATTYDVNGNAVTGRSISWSTSDAGVATVSVDGVVTTVASGSAEITANAEGRKSVVPVTVTASSSKSVAVASVTVTLNASSLAAGQSTQANATLRDAGGATLTGRSIVWTSSEPAVATVDGAGRVTALKAGAATITATSEGKSGNAPVAISAPSTTLEPVASITLSLPSSLDVGKSAQATVTLKDQAGNTLTDRAVAYVSSDHNIVSVSTTGVITALKGGAVTITVSSEGKTASAVVTSVAPKPTVASITLAAGVTTLKIGELTQVTAVPKDAAGNPIAGLSITWWSSASTVATVSSSGVAAGQSAGTAQVYAKIDAVTSSIGLTVVDEALPDPETTPSTGGTGTLQSIATLAELPRASVNTAYPAPTRQVRVAAGANLQSAIDAAQPGDELLLAPGATYIGNFALRNKGSSTAWITIRTDVSDAAIGAPGTRMTPSRAAGANLAKILTPNVASAIGTDLSAHHWRLTGLELGGTSAAQEINGIVRFGDGSWAQNTMSLVANNLILDRVYVRGMTSQAVRRCISLQSATSAIVDSWISECHSNEGDSQGIVGWNGPGPYVIRNNHVEGGHQAVMFGGADPSISNLSPSDITMIGNHFTRPSSWKGTWITKTIIETKHARRMLMEGNVIENVWQSAQAGYALLLKSTNQNGTAPWSQSTDITIRYNIIRNIGSGINIAANPDAGGAVPAARITIVDNVFSNLGTTPYNGDGIPLQILGGTYDVLVAHNSFSNAGNQAVSFDGAATTRTVIHSNILPHGWYGVKGSGTGIGTGTLNVYAPGGVFAYDVLSGGDCTYYPATTSCPSTIPSAPGLGYDARTIGADQNKVNAATSGVVVGP